LECPLENKVPRASAGISARQALSFPRFRFTNRPGGQRQPRRSRGSSSQGPGGPPAGRRGPQAPESELTPWPSRGRPGGGEGLPSLDSEWATRRPVARLPGWLLHRGGTSTWAACAWPLVQQQHTEQRARDFGRRASPLAYVRCADLTLSLATILGNLTEDHRRKIERAPPGTTIPCGEALNYRGLHPGLRTVRHAVVALRVTAAPWAT
jgi:hypothetical protein